MDDSSKNKKRKKSEAGHVGTLETERNRSEKERLHNSGKKKTKTLRYCRQSKATEQATVRATGGEQRGRKLCCSLMA